MVDLNTKTYHHSLINFERITEHMLSNGGRFNFPELWRLFFEILLVIAHLRYGEGMGAVQILRDPVRL